jgi:hypothetical protein
MIPALLRIRKKVLRPTKPKAVQIHYYRSDWITVGQIKPEQCAYFFSVIKYDSQFAYYLKKTFGTGIYSILMFRKGCHGFKSFMKVECKEDTYVRLKRKLKQEEKENIDYKSEKRRIERQLKTVQDSDQRDSMQESMNEINNLIGLNSEIVKSEKNDVYCSDYILSLAPYYKEHYYNEAYRERPKTVHRAKMIHEEENKMVEEAKSTSFSWR